MTGSPTIPGPTFSLVGLAVLAMLAGAATPASADGTRYHQCAPRAAYVANALQITGPHQPKLSVYLLLVAGL